VTAPESDCVEQRLREAFVDACLLDVLALKPGNVGIHGAGHAMSATDFVRSARAAAAPLTAPRSTVGERVLHATQRTRQVAFCNTNLGILLLAAPIAQAAYRCGVPCTAEALRATVGHVLAGTAVVDAQLAFEAIVLANPGGLGSAPRHDVRGPASVTLREAMACAAERDSVARQYANGFADIFDVGLASLHAARASGADRRQAATAVWLAVLRAFPDSHVARKFGIERARDLQQQARMFPHHDVGGMRAALLSWDRQLKGEGINPGTSADFTVATLFCDAIVRPVGNQRGRGVD
jgi:triphosphoribosyl-dephospho-CoA synthase